MSTVVGSITSVFLDLWWLWILILLGIVVLIIIIKRKKEPYYKEFEPQPFDQTLQETLEAKFDLQGIDMKRGKLFIAFQHIANIRRFFEAKGYFDATYYDKGNNRMFIGKPQIDDDPKDEETEEKTNEEEFYHLFFIEAHNNFFLYRLFGIKPTYFIIKMYDSKKNLLLRFDPHNESIILNASTDLTSYGNVWSNCDSGVEYMSDISMKRQNELLQMHVENAPDKFVHLEMEQAKKERTNRVLVDLEKSKYKDREEAGDTTIT